jgi:hypothetical protein
MKKTSQKAGGCNARKSLKGGNPSKKASQKGGSCGARKSLKGGAATPTPQPTVHHSADAPHHSADQPKMNEMNGGAKKTKKSTGAAKTIYCLKCKKQVEAKNITEITKKGKRVVKMETGTCPHCGNKVYKIVGGGKH